MNKNYYIGIDIGTDSVGWAVTDTDYNLMKFGGNAMWGIRLFDESNTAEERRTFRASRRRLNRTRERLNLLEMLFAEEITKIDPAFFLRLKESNLYPEDKICGTPYSVFSGNYTDKDYHRDYPTIQHLKKELISNSEKHDPRLVFLALHHIIKNRGHFLFEDLNVEQIQDFSEIYNNLVSYLYDNYEIELSATSIEKVGNILRNRNLGKTPKTNSLCAAFDVTKKNEQKYAILKLLAGATVDLADIFADEELDSAEKKNICFDSGYAENEEIYASLLEERFELIVLAKAVYDWGVLADILKGEQYISFAKVAVYEQHKKDLTALKSYVHKYCPDKYSEIFRASKEKLCNYLAYSKHIKKNGKNGTLNCTCSQEDFCKFVLKAIGKCADESYSDMFARLASGSFMPKQVGADNSVLPMQVNRAELVAILDNAEKYLDFLGKSDENGITVKDKIISLFDYRIPYYVGPLNTHSPYHWLKRSDEKIYPWTFERVVDLEESANRFIENLTNKCTYIPTEDVLPRSSLLFCKYTVLNELNKIRLDNNPIDISLKQDIFTNLFLKHGKVSEQQLKDYLSKSGVEYSTLSGIEGKFNATMKSYKDLERYSCLTPEDKEEVIKAITVFGEDKKLLKKRLKSLFGDKLSEEDIKKIAKLKYVGWAGLSRKLLCGIEGVNPETGEVVNIITALWQTNYNLMQLLNNENFGFKQALEIALSEADLDKPRSLKEAVEELYVSPKIKRPIYQALQIIKEIEKVQKCPPAKIFVEVARTDDAPKSRTKSRKDRLMELYSACKNSPDCHEIYKQLESCDEDRLRSDKLYLYFTQLGRCIYTGEFINMEELMGANSRWDIDHIYPRSKTKDDSLDNRVLSNREFNNRKQDVYPIAEDIRKAQSAIWKGMLEKGLISQKKYDRLVCPNPLTEDQLSGFIARQIVETGQSTVAVARILEELYKHMGCEIVYVKANLVSDFRHENDMLKSREINDLHHAKDAYLNIVVGNVHNVKCTHNKSNFIKGLMQNGSGYSLNRMFEFDIPGAWSKDSSMAVVENTMRKNNILYTRYAFKQKGGFFKQQILKKDNGQVPIKAEGPRSNIEKYGGYTSPSGAFFSLVEYTLKGKKTRSILPINLIDVKEYESNPAAYFKRAWNIDDAKVIIPCIKYNSCISINGFRMHLSSKSNEGKTLVYKPGIQLVLGYESEKYIKKISAYLEKCKKQERPVNKFDGLSKEENLAVYDAIADKLCHSIFKEQFEKLGQKFMKNNALFNNLTIENQCKLLIEILHILHSNVMTGDLSYINEAKSAGKLTTNSKITDMKGVTSIMLINQSITGLFEQEVDLLK